jgi:hypothetical protein
MCPDTCKGSSRLLTGCYSRRSLWAAIRPQAGARDARVDTRCEHPDRALAWIEPVDSVGSGKDRRHVADELGTFRAAIVPKSIVVRHVREAKDLLYSSVAVRRYDKDGSGELALRFYPHDEVVVELTPLPVFEDVVSTKIRSERIEQRTQPEILRERLYHGSKCVRRSSIRLTILAFSGGRERERSDRRVRPTATASWAVPHSSPS